MGNGVLPEVDAAPVHDLLHLKGHEYGKRFRGQRAESVDLPGADGQDGIQAVKLLVFQHRQLAPPGQGAHLFRVAVKLLFAVGGDDKGEDGLHHPLVAGGEVGQKLLALLALQLHVVGDDGGEVVVLILAALPVCDIGFYPQQTVLHLPHGLVGGHGEDVNGQHHIAVQVGQVRHDLVLDIVGVVLQEQHPAIAVAQFQVVAVLLDPVRADIVLEVVALPGHIRHIEVKTALVPGPVEVVEDTQPVSGVQFHALGAEGGKAGGQVGPDPGEVGAGVLNVPLVDGHGDKFLLDDAVGPGRLVNEHLVVLLAVLVQAVPPHSHKDRLLKVRLALAAVANGQLGGGGAVQAVQQLRVGQEHGFLVLPACHLVIDVGETVGLGELDAHLKNAVRPDALNGYHVLHPAGDAVRLPILPHDGLDTLNHGACIPPFPAYPCRVSKCRSTAWTIQSGVLAVPTAPSAATPK